MIQIMSKLVFTRSIQKVWMLESGKMKSMVVVFVTFLSFSPAVHPLSVVAMYVIPNVFPFTVKRVGIDDGVACRGVLK